jgi:hypothetical protein
VVEPLGVVLDPFDGDFLASGAVAPAFEVVRDREAIDSDTGDGATVTAGGPATVIVSRANESRFASPPPP